MSCDGHRTWEGDEDTLSRVCALHSQRKLSKELVVSFQRQRYILQTGGHPRYALERRPGFFVQIRYDGVTGYRYA